MADKKKVADAVARLDRKNENDWTTSGLPKIERVSELVGEPVTRNDINEAASGVTREGDGSGRAAGGNTPRGRAGSVPEHGGGMAVGDKGDLIESDAAAQMRATRPHKAALEADFDGPDPDEVFKALDKLVTAFSSPRYKRNQVLQQIKVQWQQGQSQARQVQEKMEKRTERRIEHRDRVKEDREERATA